MSTKSTSEEVTLENVNSDKVSIMTSEKTKYLKWNTNP